MIRHGCEPIAGSLDLPDGRTLPFEGYLQLVALLEDLRHRRPPMQSAGDSGRQYS